jgi:hypothetical protein
MNESQARQLFIEFFKHLKVNGFDITRKGEAGYMDVLVADLIVEEAAAMDMVALALQKAKRNEGRSDD